MYSIVRLISPACLLSRSALISPCPYNSCPNMAPTPKSYSGTFLPGSSGNSIACYPTVPYDAEYTNDKSRSGSSSNKASKGKQAAGKGSANGSNAHDQEVKFMEFDTLNPSRRAVSLTGSIDALMGKGSSSSIT